MAISARIDELKKKFDENPRRYFASLANEYRKAGDLNQALFICQEYLPQQPGHMSGHIVLAQTFYEMGRLPEAKAEFEAALALDPENLIALRHLGDIARQSGDPRTARNWYQRVLEADPRNSEIVDVLASLRTTPMASAAAISAIPPTPLSNPVMPPPTPLSTPVAPPPTPMASAPVEQAERPAEPPREEHELLDLDAVLGETPLSTPVVKAEAEQAAPPDLSMSIEQSPADFELSGDAFEADAFAIAAPEPSTAPDSAALEPPIESATDLNLGLIDEEFAPASLADLEPTTLEGLRSYEAGTLVKGAEPIDKSLDTESYYDVLHGGGRSTPPGATHAPQATPPSDDDFAPGLVEDDETSVAHEGSAAPAEPAAAAHDSAVTPHVSATPVDGFESFDHVGDEAFTPPPTSSEHETPALPDLDTTPAPAFTPVSSATPAESSEAVTPAVPEAERGATPASSSEIFVTETMADLYLSQGHTDSALDIYRKLLEHRPGDPRLTERIREVESRASGRTARVATPEAPSEPIVPRGPTIREFLVALVGSKPTFDSASEGVHGTTESAPSNELATGSIDALFTSAESAKSSADPSNPLVDAFSDLASDAPMLEGQPAHPASNELSLDQVFKVATPVRTEAQPEGFSFDQFFSGEASSSPTSPPNANTTPAEGTDDIAQFNAWLNGLKKT